MSWDDALAELSDALDEEFSSDAVITPMLARPNSRAVADPARPAYDLRGIFHENHRYAGKGNRSGDGLDETKIASVVCTFSAATCAFKSKPTQLDHIRICQRGRWREFRIMDVTFEMPGRSMLVLEALTRPEMA